MAAGSGPGRFTFDLLNNLNVTLAGGGGGSAGNPIFVELSDGTNPVGTAANPLSVAASEETSTIFNGKTALVPTFATVQVSSSGDNTIVSATGGKRIRVLSCCLIANAAVNVKWRTSTGPTDITGLGYFAANGGYVKPFSPVGWFQTGVGDSLILNLSAAQAVGGEIVYVLV